MEENKFVGKYSDLVIIPAYDSDSVSIEVRSQNQIEGQPRGYVIDIPLSELRSMIDKADAEGRPNSHLGRRMWAVRVATESLGVGHSGIRDLAEWLSGA